MSDKKIYYRFASDPSREYTLNLPCEGRVSCKFTRQHIIIQHTVRPDSKCFFELYRNVSTDAGNPVYKLIDNSEDILTETRLLVKRRPITRGDLEHDSYLSFDSLAPILHNIIHSDSVSDRQSYGSDSLIDANRQGIRELSKDQLMTFLEEIDNNVTMMIGKNTRNDIIGQFTTDSSPSTAREGQQFLIGQANRIHQSVAKNNNNDDDQEEDDDDKEKTTGNVAELWEKAMGYPKSFLCSTGLRESAPTPMPSGSAVATATVIANPPSVQHNTHGPTGQRSHSQGATAATHDRPGNASSAYSGSQQHGYDHGHRPDARQNEGASGKSSGSNYHYNRKQKDVPKESIKVILTDNKG